jgi:hypothetical protein
MRTGILLQIGPTATSMALAALITTPIVLPVAATGLP